MNKSIIVLMLFLTACTTTQPKTISVVVPVACAKPVVPDKPTYPIYSLKKGDRPATIAKAYVATVQLQNNYINQLISILKGV